MDNVFSHHGILGQKWGVIRSEAELARARGRKSNDTDAAKTQPRISDDELRGLISRLELEKRYADLTKTPKVQSKGKAFVMSVLEKSGTNIAQQVATYALGTLVNNIAKKEIVNPKKGQKDK
jgi:hypothetical protein